MSGNVTRRKLTKVFSGSPNRLLWESQILYIKILPQTCSFILHKSMFMINCEFSQIRKILPKWKSSIVLCQVNGSILTCYSRFIKKCILLFYYVVSIFLYVIFMKLNVKLCMKSYNPREHRQFIFKFLVINRINKTQCYFRWSCQFSKMRNIQEVLKFCKSQAFK